MVAVACVRVEATFQRLKVRNQQMELNTVHSLPPDFKYDWYETRYSTIVLERQPLE